MWRPSLSAATRNRLRVAIAAVSVAAIAAGATCNEHLTVLAKGVRVCLECMGIG